MARLLKDLPVGAKLKISDLYSAEFGRITFINLGYGHYHSYTNTIITEKIIGLYAFDAKEPFNRVNGREIYGNGDYKVSNIRQFLNSEEYKGKWYRDQHLYDEPPKADLLDDRYNPYVDNRGFLHALPSELVDVLKLTEINYVKHNVDRDSSNNKLGTVYDKVFLLSKSEVGLGSTDGVDDGKPFVYFSSNEKRLAYLSERAILNSEYKGPGLNTNSPWMWWLRTAYAGYGGEFPNSVHAVNDSGGRTNRHAYTGKYGLRPAMNIPSDLKVTDSPDAEGYYRVLFSEPPTIGGKDEDLGNKTEPFGVSYVISNPDGNALTIKEMVNGSVLRTHNSSSTHFTSRIELSHKTWENFPVNRKIEIKIEVTDSNSNKSVRTYTFVKTNSAPSAVPVEPKGDLSKIAITDTINPVLVWRFEDIDPNDAQSAYQVVIEDTNGNTVHDSKKIASSQSFYIVPDLKWATRYKWKVRVWDRYDLASNYSSYQFFLPKRRPNVTDVEPGSPSAEEPAGTGTSPEFSWTFEDLDQQAQAAYQIRIYDTKDVLVYDSSRIEKTINMHKIPEGILTEGTIYYAVVTVWDPFYLHKDSAEAYFVTNSTPTAPTLTSPANTYRTGLRPVLEGLIGSDKENDPQQFIIQISQDEKFEKHVLELSSMNDRKGWQVSNGQEWYDLAEEGVDNSYEGKGVRYTLQVDLDEGRTYYWRMAGIDANTKARGKWSNARCIRCGNMLQFKLKNPISTGNTAARRILIAADYYMANDGINKATMKIEVSNNALDTNPTWEDATSAYLNADYFTFSNSQKTAQQYALDIRVTFMANDSLGAIEMRGLGFSFD